MLSNPAFAHWAPRSPGGGACFWQSNLLELQEPDEEMEMPISRTTAQGMMQVIVRCGNELVGFLPALEKELSPEEFKRIKREIGRVISTMDDSISAKIAFDYPELAPEAVPIAHKL